MIVLKIIGAVLGSWIFGILLVILGYKLFMKIRFFDADEDQIDPENWEHVGWVALLGFLWPVALVVTIISFIAVGGAQLLQFVLTKVIK